MTQGAGQRVRQATPSPTVIPAAPSQAWPVCQVDELDARLAEGGWSLVEFWAPDCLFSRLLAPVRNRLNTTHGSRLRLLCCVLTSCDGAAASFGAVALPALVLFDRRLRVRSWLGAVDPSLLQYQIDRSMADAAP